MVHRLSLSTRAEKKKKSTHRLEELDFVQRRVRVVGGALDHLQGHKPLATARQSLRLSALAPENETRERALLTRGPSRARPWRNGPSPACAPRGTDCGTGPQSSPGGSPLQRTRWPRNAVPLHTSSAERCTSPTLMAKEEWMNRQCESGINGVCRVTSHFIGGSPYLWVCQVTKLASKCSLCIYGFLDRQFEFLRTSQVNMFAGSDTSIKT